MLNIASACSSFVRLSMLYYRWNVRRAYPVGPGYARLTPTLRSQREG